MCFDRSFGWKLYKWGRRIRQNKRGQIRRCRKNYIHRRYNVRRPRCHGSSHIQRSNIRGPNIKRRNIRRRKFKKWVRKFQSDFSDEDVIMNDDDIIETKIILPKVYEQDLVNTWITPSKTHSIRNKYKRSQKRGNQSGRKKKNLTTKQNVNFAGKQQRPKETFQKTKTNRIISYPFERYNDLSRFRTVDPDQLPPIKKQRNASPDKSMSNPRRRPKPIEPNVSTTQDHVNSCTLQHQMCVLVLVFLFCYIFVDSIACYIIMHVIFVPNPSATSFEQEDQHKLNFNLNVNIGESIKCENAFFYM